MTTLPPEGTTPESTGDNAGQPSTPGYLPPQQPTQQPPAGYAPPPGYSPPPGSAPPGAPQQGYPQPVADPVNNITLNYWLSVFFSWIPALIFYIIEKDKGDPRVTAFHAANLNFSLIRVGVGVVTLIFIWIPILGWIIGGLLGLVSLGLFILHIVAAASAADDFRGGRKPNFLFNIDMVK